MDDEERETGIPSADRAAPCGKARTIPHPPGRTASDGASQAPVAGRKLHSPKLNHRLERVQNLDRLRTRPDNLLDRLYSFLLVALYHLADAFLELRDIKPYGNFGKTDVPRISPEIRKVFKGPLVLNQEYTKELADADLASGLADAISFGRPYISNPDLVERLRTGAELTPDNFKTWYTPAAEGYTDYPFLEQADA